MKDQAVLIPTGSRSARLAVLAAKLLVLVLLAMSARPLLAPAEAVHKSEDSKRPKSPQKVVRAEPVRIPSDEKQGQRPSLPRPAAEAESLSGGLAWSVQFQALPVKAFTQLTKPDYLKTGSAGLPPTPLAPPA
jgi:hypothetical protein